ncbi:MAG: hypothetical protein AAFU41_00515, partial [Pseudomonadota bacterium]
VISDQREGITRLIERIDSFDEKLEYAQYGVLGTLAGALVVQKAIDVFGPDAPPAVQAANATIEAKLQVATDNLMTNFNAPDLETAFAGFDTDFDAMLAGISGFGSLGSVLRTIEREFNNVYSKIAFLDGPLDGLVDALDGFFWVLEKAEWLISKILDPIVDPILEATGVTSLIRNLADKITSLLPNIAVLNPFDDLGAALEEIIGDIGLFDDLDALADLFALEADFLGSLSLPATDGDDLLIAFAGLPGDLGSILDYSFDGLGGDDVIMGAGGDDTIQGGSGADMIIGSGGEDQVDGGAGLEDVLALTGEFTDYALRYEETAPNTWDFFLTYIGGDRSLVGSMDVTGIEYLSFNGVTFTASELANAQTIDYTGGNRTLNGTPLADLLLGGPEADTILAGGGDDTLIGFGGKDILDGGDGIDTVDYAPEATDFIRVYLDPTHPDAANATDTLINIENVVGGAFADFILGDDNANRLNGGKGSDVLHGFGGDDILIGGAGVDFGLWGGDGNDTLIGGADRDVYFGSKGEDLYADIDDAANNLIYYGEDTSGVVSAYLTPFVADGVDDFPDRIEVTIGSDMITTVDKFHDGVVTQDRLEGAFTIYGTAGNDQFQLANQTDFLEGLGGNDLFIGYMPDTTISESIFGAPDIWGGADSDTLLSQTGDENFYGEEGDDRVALSILFGVDSAPEDDDVLDDNGDVIENAGARVRELSGGIGTDTLDLTGSDLSWVFVMNDNDGTGEAWSDLISTLDIVPGFRDLFVQIDELKPSLFDAYADLPDFEAHDQFRVQQWERILGSEQADTFTIIDNDASSSYANPLYFEGNGGDDYLKAYDSTAGIVADMGDGDDDVVSSKGADTVMGGAGNDRIWITPNSSGQTEIYDGGAGNDYMAIHDDGRFERTFNAVFDLTGGEGFDVLDLGDLDMDMTIDLGSQTFSGGFNSDQVSGGFTGFEAVIGGRRANTITGTEQANIISGGRLQDTIFARGGNDIIYAGTYPVLFNSWGADIEINAGTGDDVVYVSGGGGTIDGDEGFDTVRLAGILEYSPDLGFTTNYDTHVFDQFDVVYDSFYWRVDLATGQAQQGTIGFYTGVPINDSAVGLVTLLNFESFIGSLGDDTFDAAFADSEGVGSTIDGSDGDDTLNGRDGDDTLSGGRGNDTINGGDGDDSLTPGPGMDVVNGGAGFDKLDLRAGAQGITIDATAGFASYEFDDQFPLLGSGGVPGIIASTVTFTSIEDFNLSDEADSFTGSGIGETVRGWDGDDIISGGGGGDTLFGGAGNDTIRGDSETPGSRVMDLVLINQDGARDDRLEAASIAMPTDAFTIEMMINGNDPVAGTEASVVSYSSGTNASTNELLFIFSDFGTTSGDHVMRLIINGAFIDTTLSATSLLDGTDHRLSFTWDASDGTVAIFVDGILGWTDTIASFAGPIDGTGWLMFGQDQDSHGGTISPNQAFIGGIGDIRIYDSVLDGATILANASAPLEDPGSDNSLQHYWTVDAHDQQIITEKGTTLANTGGEAFLQADLDASNVLDGGGGNDTLIGGDFGDVLADPYGDDTLTGGNGDNVFTVLSGTNTLTGGTGRDLMQGGIGNDTMSGQAGRDVLIADISDFVFGNDTLEGGEGADLLSGGRGEDTFIFNPGDGTDTIAVFNVDFDNPAIIGIDGPDWQVGLDTAVFDGFGYTAAAQIFDQISDENGRATFRDQNTVVIFHDLTKAQLSVDDFAFV